MSGGTDHWFDFGKRTLVDAGLSIGAAYKLLQILDRTPSFARPSLFDDAVRTAADLLPAMVAKAKKQPKWHGVRLDAKRAAAFCEVAAYHPDPGMRRAVAMALAKERWIDGMPLLGYLAADANPMVRWGALFGLRKLNYPLYRVLIGSQTLPDLSGFDADTPVVDPFSADTFGPDMVGEELRPLEEFEKTVNEGAGAADVATDRGGAAAASRDLPSVPPTAPTPAQSIRRFTAIDYEADSEQRHKGNVVIAFRLKAASSSSKTVDLRVLEGREAASLILHAGSLDFKVIPETQSIRVPRNGDSDVARFTVEARGEVTGDVAVTIFDDTRLVGSLIVKMSAQVIDDELTLRKLKGEVFRDAGGSAQIRGFGQTIQVSFAEGTDRRIQFNALAAGASGDAELIPLGTSRESFYSAALQVALATFRKDIKTIADSLPKPETIGASSRSDVLKALEQKLRSLGTLIYGDLISPAVRTLLVKQSPDTVVHWAIKNSELDAVPWELAFQKFGVSPMSAPPLLIRVPVWTKDAAPEAAATIPAGRAGATTKKIAYLLGTGVVSVPPGAERYQSLLSVLRKADSMKFAVQPNFSASELQPVSITTLPGLIADARIIHMLCHGVVDADADVYLQLQVNALGQVRPTDIYAYRLSARPLVFVNACSSSAAGLSAAGFTTFGKSFLDVGASAYIGTLAPVVTETALAFATEFFDACLGEGLSVAAALNKVRKSMSASPDPSWRLYTVYGDLQATESLIN
jgi:CHAT domain